MVQVEGSYTTVRGQEFVDLYVHLGVEKDKAQKALGSHWGMKVWREGDKWGCHFTCRELPHLNSLEVSAVGVEKCIDSPLTGGKAKLHVKKLSDTEFSTTIQSEKFGNILVEEKYTDEGVHFKWTGKGKTVTEFWERSIKVEGAYRFEKGENVEEFCKATGHPDMAKHLTDYRMYLWKTGDVMNMAEWFGDLGKVRNTIRLDVEAPFKTPFDKEGSEGSQRAIMTKTGNGKSLMVIKTPEGKIEEWKFTFAECGLLLEGFDKKSGATCKFWLKRFVEMSGTYKRVSFIGFEKFAHEMGLPCHKIQEIANDCSARLTICDKGNGFQHHKLTGKGESLDINFKFNEEFTFLHPFLNENVKAVATIHDNVLCCNLHTSKGVINSSITFNDHFSVMAVSHPGTGLGYKAILERCCE
jgi:hypothetical protein